MTNTKTGKSLKDKTTIINNNADNNCTDDVGQRTWSENVVSRGFDYDFKEDESLENSSDADDQVPNSADTTTSFSLQECMDEFRARRRRKSTVSQNRQEVEDCKNKTYFVDATEQDLINQNLCNKLQERKCKPCRNGFCYCFTSDSGDGGANFGGCARVVTARNQRHSKRVEREQISNQFKNKVINSKARSHNKEFFRTRKTSDKTHANKIKSGKISQMKAISRLETSARDAPLVHITQELRNNCVISEVRVNKDKINSSLLCAKRKNVDNCKQFSYSIQGTLKPTAPSLEQILEDKNQKKPEDNKNTTSVLDKSMQYIECKARRSNFGGLLLKKRMIHSDFNYKPRNPINPPPKPPRNSVCSEGKYSSSSESTSSVKEAEKILDEFLAKNGIQATGVSSKLDGKIRSCSKPPKEIKRKSENFLKTHPSLNDIGRFVESKKGTDISKNNLPLVESEAKLLSDDWSDSKIHHMLNYETTAKYNKFQTAEEQAQPQQHAKREDKSFQNPIGWQIPPKLSLDTVDGGERHNLAANLIDKNTPVKTKLTPKLKSSTTQKFLWSEQLRQLTPWSNKNKRNESTENRLNLRSTSKDFIKTSKKKILSLVSPKKENKDCINLEIRKTPLRNVAVQTSHVDVHGCNNDYKNDSSPQSPPGSYHSPIQSSHIHFPSSTQSQNTTPKAKECISEHFDFSRVVNSPPKKTLRSSHRKLDFAWKENETEKDGVDSILDLAKGRKTYHSFNRDLNQDVSISKLSYILSDIRTKLEESDEKANRTFSETKFNAEHAANGFDCPDSHQTMKDELNLRKCNSRKIELSTREISLNDPIYSEIEENSFHIAESPSFDNYTEIENVKNSNCPELLYAKVNKRPKPVVTTECQPHNQQNVQPLGKIIQDSMKTKKILTNIMPLPPLPEPPENESDCTGHLSHCQSLNNVRVVEHKHNYLSKSDLSLYRSEIFLENLCKSELIVDTQFSQDNLAKVQNSRKCSSYKSTLLSKPIGDPNTLFERKKRLQPESNVLYEINNRDGDNFVDNIGISPTNVADNPPPPSCNNQSTPKKQSFTTKDDIKIDELDVASTNNSGQAYNSCPNMLCDLYDICSFNEATEHENLKNFYTSSILSSRYKSFKNVLRKSFKKSKEIIKNEKKRLSTSLNLSSTNVLANPIIYGSSTNSDFNPTLNLEELFLLDESVPVREQISYTVSVCRKLPELETSSEMVEAERLLLFSTLRLQNQPASIVSLKKETIYGLRKIRVFVDDMILPINTDVNKDIYFNHFYIVTFNCGGVIKSTQSVECENGSAIFRDCGLEFELSSHLETEIKNESCHQNMIRCKVFMLRLRKISTHPTEHNKRTNKLLMERFPSSTISSSRSSSSENEVVSRFRLQGSFDISANEFVPYEYVPQALHNFDQICLRASKSCNISIISETKSINFPKEIRLKGRVEARFAKRVFEGFLNVEDLCLRHNWNRRWCVLDGINLYVWRDENTMNSNPLIAIDLRDTKQYSDCPLTNTPRELCARPRTFSLEYIIRKESENSYRSSVYFSAESQAELDDWLQNINNTLDFITTWLC
ncbi:hypothetical protein DOY81_004306 [Sarcophaga bullata]|nr:hypothetical protein DOY81_004306 [Sarcophaga bullata]